MPNVKGFLVDKFGFGDLMATLYSLENVGRQTGEVFELNLVKDAWVTVFKEFSFDHIRLNRTNTFPCLVQTVRSAKGEPPCKNHVIHNPPNQKPYYLISQHYISLLMAYLRSQYSYIPRQATPIKPKNVIVESNGLVLTQFDGRTVKAQGRDIITHAKLEIIKRSAGDRPWACIGGLDTPNYFGNQAMYKKLKIDDIIKEVQKCELFVGCDSGMSHLIGSLGVKSNIYIMGECFECLRRYYVCYRNCEIKRMPKTKML